MKLALIAFSLAAASCHVGQLSDDVHAVSTQTVEAEKSLKETSDELREFIKEARGFFQAVTNPKVDVTTNGPSETFIGACTGLIMAALGVYRAWGNRHTQQLVQATNAQTVAVTNAVKGNGQ